MTDDLRNALRAALVAANADPNHADETIVGPGGAETLGTFGTIRALLEADEPGSTDHYSLTGEWPRDAS